MSEALVDTVKRALEAGETGQGKQLDLEEAVRCHVRPGMTVHLAAGIGGP